MSMTYTFFFIILVIPSTFAPPAGLFIAFRAGMVLFIKTRLNQCMSMFICNKQVSFDNPEHFSLPVGRDEFSTKQDPVTYF